MFIFVDVETSGLDPYIADVTEIAAVYVDDDYNVDIKHPFHIRLFIQNPENVEEEALEISHYNESLWEKTGVKAEEGILKFNEWLKKKSPSRKPIIVAANAEFDKSMIFATCDRFHISPFIDPVWLDMIGLWIVYKHKHGLMHLGNSQAVIAKHFNIKNPKAHQALADSATGAICFSKMMKLLNFQTDES